jgi:hypothetical protein
MLKKTVVVFSVVLALLLGACQNIFTPTVAPGPTGDSAATSDALFQTAVAQTLTAQPSPTLVTSFDTATLPVGVASPTLVGTDNTATLPAESPTLPPTDVVALTASPLPPATASPTLAVATGTGLPPTSTPFPSNLTSTSTLPAGQVTAVWTLAVRKYGTLPPAVPFSQVTLINKAKTEAYISLQVTMPDGQYSILEYPVEGRVRIQAPVGSYLYVAWVGGRKMVGEFRLHQNDDLSITLYRDKIVIK